MRFPQISIRSILAAAYFWVARAVCSPNGHFEMTFYTNFEAETLSALGSLELKLLNFLGIINTTKWFFI